MRVSLLLAFAIAAVFAADTTAAQTGAVATSARVAAPGGTISGGTGSATGAPTPVHIGTRPNCSSPNCVTTALVDASILPDLFYEKTRLLGKSMRATVGLKLCVFAGGSATRCPAGGDVTYSVSRPMMANLRGLTMINFAPGCFVLRWENPELVSTPFAVVASSDAGFPCAGR
jgi:hypothetical protein